MPDKLARQAHPNIVRACENIVKAPEACMVTFSTEYHVKAPIIIGMICSKMTRWLLKYFRSGICARSCDQLSLRKGRLPDGDRQMFRREILSLYRWTGDGTELAL